MSADSNVALSPRYLEVWLHDQMIGWLCEAGRATRFVAAESYLLSKQRPTLSLSLSIPGNEELTREILNAHFDPALYRERGELPAFFAGLLPEGALRKRLEATRHHQRDCDDFGILAAAGEDLPGALKIIPAHLDRLTAAARAIGVTGGADNLEISVPEAATEGAASVSGIQNKIALSMANQGKRFILPVKGSLSNIIAKLPANNDDSQVFNEFTAMQLAALAGVNIAVCQPRPMNEIAIPELVAQLGEKTHFLAVERFDRSATGPVHMEDACQFQTLMPNQKYASRKHYINLIRIIDRLSVRGVEDVRQFFVRQVVNTLLGNCDAHLKNYSLIYRDGIHPELSPAYDIVCVAALPNFKGFAINMAIDEAQKTESVETYKQFARDAKIAERIVITAVKDTVQRAQDSWPKALENSTAPESVKKEIHHRLATLPLAKISV